MMKKTLLASLLALSFVGSAGAATVTLTDKYDVSSSGTMIGPFVEKATPPADYYGLKVTGSGTTQIEFTLFPLNTGTPPTMQFRLFADTDGVFDNSATFDNSPAGILQYWNVTGSQPVNMLNLSAGLYVFSVLLDPTPDGGSSGNVSAVPVPAAAWLFGSALFGAGALRRKQKTA